MANMMIALLVILVILLISIAIGGPIAVTLGFTASIATLLFLTSGHLSFLGTTMYDNAISSNNVIVPLFIMMAEFMAKGGIAEDLFYVFAKYLRKIRGGLAVATTLACTVFAALCGSSPATAATIGKVSLEAMRKHGTDTTRRMYFTEYSTLSPEEVSYCVAVPPESKGEYICNLPEFQAISLFHHGAYEEIPLAIEKLVCYAEKNNIKLTGTLRNLYLEGPPQHKEKSNYITQIIALIEP